MNTSLDTTNHNRAPSRYARLARRAIAQSRKAKAAGNEEMAHHFAVLAAEAVDEHLAWLKAARA